ncbi:hypothetical protein NL676_006116 [Syzygium grande]|nr:hypothetical protein NL676_006116 [Syzygium grande]
MNHCRPSKLLRRGSSVYNRGMGGGNLWRGGEGKRMFAEPQLEKEQAHAKIEAYKVRASDLRLGGAQLRSRARSTSFLISEA